MLAQPATGPEDPKLRGLSLGARHQPWRGGVVHEGQAPAGGGVMHGLGRGVSGGSVVALEDEVRTRAIAPPQHERVVGGVRCDAERGPFLRGGAEHGQHVGGGGGGGGGGGWTGGVEEALARSPVAGQGVSVARQA